MPERQSAVAVICTGAPLGAGIAKSTTVINAVLFWNAPQSDRSSGRTTHFTNSSPSDSKNLFHNNDCQADIEPIFSVLTIFAVRINSPNRSTVATFKPTAEESNA